MNNYILDNDRNPVREPDIIKWGRWYETAGRHVAKDKIGDVMVSTVFLGIDHSYNGGTPVLYETMIFGGKHDQFQDRYTNQIAALAGHDQAVAKVRETLKVK